MTLTNSAISSAPMMYTSHYSDMAMKTPNVVDESQQLVFNAPCKASAKETVDKAKKCKYKTGKCFNERAKKQNGNLHNLCEQHRMKANRNQRRLDRKKHKRKIRVYCREVDGPLPPSKFSVSKDMDSFANNYDNLTASFNSSKEDFIKEEKSMVPSLNSIGTLGGNRFPNFPHKLIDMSMEKLSPPSFDCTHDLTYLEKSLQQPIPFPSLGNNLKVWSMSSEKPSKFSKLLDGSRELPSLPTSAQEVHQIKHEFSNGRSDLSPQEVQMIFTSLSHEDFN